MPAGPGFPSGRGGRSHGPGAPYMAVTGVTRFEPKGNVGKGSGPIGQGPQFNSLAQQFRGRFLLTGFAFDKPVLEGGTGLPIVGAIVELYQTGSDTVLGVTTTDGTGAYLFYVGFNSGNFYCRAYLPGSPDTFGTTVNTLVAVSVVP